MVRIKINNKDDDKQCLEIRERYTLASIAIVAVIMIATVAMIPATSA